MSEGFARVRRVEVLVAPLITFAAVVALLIAARVYDKLPVQSPDCGFKSSFGIPCVSCGGTRSMRALSAGRFVEAIRYNPSVVIGVFASFSWGAFAILRYRSGGAPLPVPEQDRRIKRVASITICLLALNWIYLILFLK